MAKTSKVRTIWKWTYRTLSLFIIVILVRTCFAMEFLFADVDLGMSRTAVIKAMGEEPRRQEEQLNFCKRWPEKSFWLGDCKAALKSNAAVYLIWKFGPDTYYVVGFDADDKAVYKSRGDA